MTQHNFGASVGRGENVLSLSAIVRDSGATALDLVYQAADVFRSMEEHARETEARAQSLCASALEKCELPKCELRPPSGRNVNSSSLQNISCKMLAEPLSKPSRVLKPKKIS